MIESKHETISNKCTAQSQKRRPWKPRAGYLIAKVPLELMINFPERTAWLIECQSSEGTQIIRPQRLRQSCLLKPS